ncbi:MAG TPA: hypothetical protein VNU01_05350, partial [Egibacteraceae bacterium]|nr:hypothetical protein [Egibacteraceae bacterium]
MAADGGPEERAHGLRLVATGAAVVVLIGLAGVTVREAARLAPGTTGDPEVLAGSDAGTSEPSPPPAPGSWELLPRAPIASRADALALWTGSEVFVWGGWSESGGRRSALADGALYEPARPGWRARWSP